MPSIFGYLSAEVDWCEENFKHSEYIAEYYNTISNVGFFIVPLLLLWLNTPYNQHRSVPLLAVTVMQMLVGLNICVATILVYRTTQISTIFLTGANLTRPCNAGVFSIYFHMTLSYAGQLLDELSILWSLCLCYGLWYPERHLPGFVKNRDQFFRLVVITTVLCTFLSFLKPALNAYMLNCIAIHLFYLTAQNLKNCNNSRIHRLALSMTVWWTISITCWIVDKLLCGFCQKINFCYLHSFWHVFISLAIFYCVTLILYFDVLYDLPTSKPEVTYWPSDTSPIALPYITFEKTQKWC